MGCRFTKMIKNNIVSKSDSASYHIIQTSKCSQDCQVQCPSTALLFDSGGAVWSRSLILLIKSYYGNQAKPVAILSVIVRIKTCTFGINQP